MKMMMLALMVAAVPIAGAAAQGPTAAERMNAPGPEATALAARAGRWRVVASFTPAAGAVPQVTRELVAERRMIGPFLQEVMRPAPGASTPDFQRIDYLGFDRVESRWEYVSLDTRLPVGIMPAWSFERGKTDKIQLQFEPIAFVGLGRDVEGRMVRSDLSIERIDADHEIKRQRFISSDGNSGPWEAVRYEYTRLKD